MKKMTKKIANQVLDHYIENSRELGYISDSLDALDVNPVLFFAFLKAEENVDLKIKYDEAFEMLSIYQNEQLTKKLFSSDKYNANVVSKMIEARNKQLYEKKEIDKSDSDFSNMTDEQLNEAIENLNKELKMR